MQMKNCKKILGLFLVLVLIVSRLSVLGNVQASETKEKVVRIFGSGSCRSNQQI